MLLACTCACILAMDILAQWPSFIMDRLKRVGQFGLLLTNMKNGVVFYTDFSGYDSLREGTRLYFQIFESVGWIVGPKDTCHGHPRFLLGLRGAWYAVIFWRSRAGFKKFRIRLQVSFFEDLKVFRHADLRRKSCSRSAGLR
jgi:hypothetical protein